MRSGWLRWFAAVVGPVSAQAAPLVDLPLAGGLQNDGSLGGLAQLVEYVPGQGPRWGLGPTGLGLDLSRSARAGGNDTSLAGGAVVIDHPGLRGLRRFTFVAWLRSVDPAGPARVAYMHGAWDLWLANRRLGVKLVVDGKDVQVATPPAELGDGWQFVAVALDGEAGRASVYLGSRAERPAEHRAYEGVPAPDAGAGRLELGNLAGIRPFRGGLARVRLFDVVLDTAQIASLYDQDLVRGGLAATARPRTDPVGFAYSDICLSTRSPRPNSLEVIRSFSANRVVWVYTNDAGYVAQVHAAGATLQGAINTIPRTPDLSAYAVDLDGTPLVAPWMAGFSRTDPVKWGCQNQPAYRAANFAQATGALDAGADWIQFDDWWLGVSAHSWGGGCLCDRCVAGFAEYLAGLTPDRLAELGVERAEGFDYRVWLRAHDIPDAATYQKRKRDLPLAAAFVDYQRRSVRAFFEDLRARLDAHAGRRVLLSVNGNLQNPSQDQHFMADLVDAYIGETWSEALPDLAICARAAEALGKHQIVSPFPHHVSDARLGLAATYALGEFYLVPFDIWMGPESKERYYGTVEEYGDLYAFIRAHRELFDGFENPGLVGLVVDLDRYSAETVRRAADRLLTAQVPFAIVACGHRYYDLPLDPDRLGAARLLLDLTDRGSLDPADAAVLEATAARACVLRPEELTDELLAALRPVDVWGPEGLYALPRVRPGGRELVAHVLNRVRSSAHGPVVPLAHVGLGLRREAALGATIQRADWFAPGAEPAELTVEELPGMWRLVLPRLAEWGVVRVTFAD